MSPKRPCSEARIQQLAEARASKKAKIAVKPAAAKPTVVRSSDSALHRALNLHTRAGDAETLLLVLRHAIQAEDAPWRQDANRCLLLDALRSLLVDVPMHVNKKTQRRRLHS